MCRKILWYYILALTLLDISLKTKLTAQGKSNGATLDDSLLIDGINFQEWGSDADGGSLPEGLVLEPATLNFGRSALAAPHVRSVTLANNGNSTLHLASVAGTTPDFHASFFESKTLAPQSNTTFNVVYLGRREGPAAAHLYIHTSLGVYNYPVSAVGVASEYDVWPLVGVRVPANASVEPMLTLYNPTDTTIQVSEVYSSGAWLGLQLPSGEAGGPQGLWAVPPHASRDIVRLRVAPPAHATHVAHDAHDVHDAHHAQAEDGPAQRPLTAYVRLKANIPGGSLVVGVEALAAAAGEHAQPLHLHLRTRAHRDPPLKVVVRAANSARVPVALAGSVATRCVRAPLAPPSPCAKPSHAHPHPHNGADTTTGAHLEVLLSQLEPFQNFTDVAQLTIDYAQLWASAGGRSELACAGCVRLGRAWLPYSLRLVAGTLRLHPASLHFVMGEEGPEVDAISLRATNECERAVHVFDLALSADGQPHFHLEARTPLVLGAGQGGELARLRVARAAQPEPPVAASLTLRTNLSDYRVPVLLYSGRFQLEWEWPWEASEGQVSLGALGTSATRRVSVRLRNTGPSRLCVTSLDAHLSQGSAQLALAACANTPPDHPCRCAEGGGWVQAWLVVVAPARAGLVQGRAGVRTRHGGSEAVLSLRALPGRLRAPRLDLPPAAPYAWSSAELVVESTMELEMRVLNVSQPTPDPAVSYKAGAGVVREGRHAVGRLLFAPEHLCQPHCYTGLDIASAEGLTWLVRSDASDEMESLREDAIMMQTRLERFERQHQLQRNLSLHLHTTEVKQISVAGSVQLHWPRLRVGTVRPEGGEAGEEAPGGEGEAEGGVLAAVGATRTLRVVARNPSRSHALLLQPAIHVDLRLPELAGGESAARCENGSCLWAAQAFAVRGWRARRGLVREWGPAGDAHPILLLAPAAELELTLSFTPPAPKRLAAYLYLRNNLTILEGVLLTGEGAYPSFELAGRKPGSASPIVFEVTECSAGAAGAGGGVGGGGVRRTVLVRNTGRVRLRLRDWRLSGAACQGRGFLLEPCAPLSLAPNESRALHLTFAPDFTLARVSVRLQLRSDLGRAEFALRATVPARLLPRCAAHVPRPPWEPALRAAAALAALAALVLVVAASALDAERLLRKARAARAHAPPRAPLDLRAPAPSAAPLAVAPSPLGRVPAPRRRRAPRRPLPPLDPQAERRAFERWRAEVLRRADDDDSRSSEDADSASLDADSPPLNRDLVVPLLDDDTFESPGTPPDIDDSEPEREVDEEEERPSNSGDEDAISLDSDVSTPTSERGDNGERSEPDESETTAEGDSPVETSEEKSPSPPTAPDVRGVPGGTPVRVARPRCEVGEAGRRGERARTLASAETPPARARAAVAKQHARKEKGTKRRSERAVGPPSRASPAQPEAAEEPAEAGTEVEVRSVGGAGALRWGTSWSSVVAARGALAPIGSDVRRRSPGPRAPVAPPAPSAPPSAPDHSLFYFNSGAARDELPWRAPQPPTLPYATVSHDFLDESSVVGGVGGVGAGASAFGGLGSAWDGGAWAWGALGAVRPPPGFGAPPRPPRAYDPFRSLASIWAPGAADWRLDAPSAPAPSTTAPANAAPPDPDDER